MSEDDGLLRVVIVLGVVLLLLPVVMIAIAMPMMGGMHAGAWDGSTMWGTGGWWLLSMLLPVVAITIVAYAGYRVLSSRDDSAIEELRRAYARGELTDEEYETRKQRLENDSGE